MRGAALAFLLVACARASLINQIAPPLQGTLLGFEFVRELGRYFHITDDGVLMYAYQATLREDGWGVQEIPLEDIIPHRELWPTPTLGSMLRVGAEEMLGMGYDDTNFYYLWSHTRAHMGVLARKSRSTGAVHTELIPIDGAVHTCGRDYIAIGRLMRHLGSARIVVAPGPILACAGPDFLYVDAHGGARTRAHVRVCAEAVHARVCAEGLYALQHGNGTVSVHAGARTLGAVRARTFTCTGARLYAGMPDYDTLGRVFVYALPDMQYLGNVTMGLDVARMSMDSYYSRAEFGAHIQALGDFLAIGAPRMRTPGVHTRGALFFYESL